MAEAAFHPGGEAHLPLQGLDQGEGFRLVVEALGEAFQAGKEFLLGDLPRLGQAVEGEEEVGEGGEGFGGEGLGGEGPSGEAAGDEDAPSAPWITARTRLPKPARAMRRARRPARWASSLR